MKMQNSTRRVKKENKDLDDACGGGCAGNVCSIESHAEAREKQRSAMKNYTHEGL
jgi:hypothetical protein